MRFQHGVEDSPTREPISATDRAAFSCRTARIFRSMASIEIIFLFHWRSALYIEKSSKSSAVCRRTRRGGICARESAQQRDAAASRFLVRFRFLLFLSDGDADHAACATGGRYRALSPVSARPPVQGPGLAQLSVQSLSRKGPPYVARPRADLP